MNKPHPQVAAVFKRAVQAHRAGALADAAKGYQFVLVHQPDNFQALLYYGILAGQLHRFEQAAGLLRQAVKAQPRHAAAHYNRAEEAVAAFERAIALKPDAIFYFDLCRVLITLERFGQAIDVLDKARAADPDMPYLEGYRQYIRRSVCDWAGSGEEIAALEAGIRDGSTVAPAFPLLLFTDSPQVQKANAERLVAERWPDRNANPRFAPKAPGDKIRIGYFSSDFRRHPGSNLMAELIGRHDRSRFECIAFVFPPQRDEVSERIEAKFDDVVDIRGLPDQAVAELARRRGIDIAIDRNGHTDNCRPDIFAWRAAPVQVGYLGYPGTTGAPYIDYIVADPVVIPEDSSGFYSEAIARLPHCYMPSDTTRAVADRHPSRAELGLPEDAFVFCCFNNAPKITPETFSGWMRILDRVPDSVLWLLGYNAGAEANLRATAREAGIDPRRLVFAPRLPLAEHLARHRVIDLFLDCFPYNAHTTASDALWMGVPVLTRAGRSFASRVAASLLNALELPGLITDNPEDFESLAVALASDGTRLQALKEKLAGKRRTAPLFDMAAYTLHLESAFEQMVARWRQGLGPQDFTVDQTV